MDRVIIYPGAIPLETDLLQSQKNNMVAVSKLAEMLMGGRTSVVGLQCVPTGPASLQVQINPGQIYQLANLDETAFSSLTADTTHNILKQGVLLDSLLLTCAAPGVVGQSINYLVQAKYLSVDDTLVALPYYNASNPAVAYTGPANSGTAQNTRRAGTVSLSAKAGVPAATGSQATPAADAGYVGLWVITVAYGQTTIVAGNISMAAGAPYASTYGTDSGAANAYASTVALPSVILAPGVLAQFKAGYSNTGASTFALNGGAAVAIKGPSGADLAVNDIAAGQIVELMYDGTYWQMVTPAANVNKFGGFKNKFINGNLAIWQAGTTQSADGYGSADMFGFYSTGTTKVVSQQPAVPGQIPSEPKYFLRVVTTSVGGASNRCYFDQRIESARTFAGKTVTVSFRAKADANKNIAISQNQFFGVGGSAEVNSFVATLALTTAWQRFSVTFAVPSISGITVGTGLDDFFRLLFWLDAGSSLNASTGNLGQQSGTFDFDEFQIEEGPVATSFEYRPIAAELALCQRYFETAYHSNWCGSGLSSATIYINIQFRVTKRVVPTVTLSNPLYTNNAGTGGLTGTPTIAGNTIDRFELRMAGMTSGSGITAGWFADARL